jgi:hypothetical protein
MPEREGRRYTGAEDFMSLFSPDAPWQGAARHIRVFKLYGEWVVGSATDAQLKQVVSDLQRRGIALAIEGGPLEAAGCGTGVEGFARAQWARIASRIAAAGGTIDYIDMDEPYYFGHFFGGSQACRWSSEIIARQLASFINEIHQQFPNALIGDAEPLAAPADADAYMKWMQLFTDVTGLRLAHLHIDVDWRRRMWPQEVKSIEDYGRSLGIPVGIIYTGNSADHSDRIWLSNSGERVKRYELGVNGRPEHVLFQSWHDKPDHLLPETAEFTFTHFIDAYFADKSRLGYNRGSGVNLGYGKSAISSDSYDDQTATRAIDGDTATTWNSGGFAPQWLQIQLGGTFDIKAVRLIVSQTPAGSTSHEVYAEGPGTNGTWRLLHRFQGETSDGQMLEYLFPRPIVGIKSIKVLTTHSPSWVGWREIEVIDAGLQQ